MSERRETKRSHLAERWERLNGPHRIGGVDLARGLAVLGMFAAHLLWIEPLDFADSSTWVDIVNGRSSILFATLAGVSIGIVTGGRTPLTGHRLEVVRLRLVVRAGLLWLIGLLLIWSRVPVYVILPAYAILFLLALPFIVFGARALLLLAGTLAVVMPVIQVALDSLPLWSTPAGSDLSTLLGWHYPFTVWIAFVLAGLGVARAGILRARVQLWMLGAGALLAVIGYGLDAVTGAGDAAEAISYWGAVWTSRAHSSGVLEVIGTGGFALAVIGACLLLCRTVLTWVVLPLRAVGAMPLTAYVAQLVVWAIVATAVLGDAGDLRGFRDLEPFWPLALWTIAACTAWALLVGRGPLEWVVDRLARLMAPGRVGRVER
ncbi:DUF418 domain-containing protein [Microbacterium pumilum]|uniref:DUF418 domain-containing protein n=1 Tax=Microbacterium pumilum TaxID=344165 RepID=UPI0031E43D4B